MQVSLLRVDFASLSEVKAQLSAKLTRVDSLKRMLAITVNGRPKAMVLPYSEFLKMMEAKDYEQRQLTLKDWEKESKSRRAVVESVQKMFDISRLSRKGQKPYKQNALKEFSKVKK